MIKEIELTQGKVAIVDDDTYEELNKYNWFAHRNSNTYYADRRGKQLEGDLVSMHRQILGLKYRDGKIADHINRNGLDNRRSNLRVVSRSGNQHSRRVSKNNVSGHNGVFWLISRRKWEARIKVNNRSIHLGFFEDIKDAVEARRQGELKYWGEEK